MNPLFKFKLRRSLQSSSSLDSNREDFSSESQTKAVIDHNTTLQKHLFDSIVESQRRIETEKTIKLLQSKVDEMIATQAIVLKEVRTNQILLNDMLKQLLLSQNSSKTFEPKCNDEDLASILSTTTDDDDDQDEDADEVSVSAYLKERGIYTIQKQQGM